MKLLFISHNIVGAGTYLRAYHLGRHLADRGHEVTILATSRTARLGISESTQGRLKIVAFPDLLSGRLRNGVCPWNLLRRLLYLGLGRFDLVHAFDARPVVILPALYARLRLKIPLLIDWADWWGRGGTIRERSGRLYASTLGWIETFFEEYFRRFADGATAISQALRLRLIGLGYPADRILLLRNGSDLPAGAPPDKESGRRTLGLPADLRLVGHLGTLFDRDARLLSDSIELLGREPDAPRLVLIGRHRCRLPGGVRRRLFIETGEIAPDLIPVWLSACDVLALPLRRSLANEGRWPSKVNDYLASGRPVVSTPVGDIRAIFEAEGIGVLADDEPGAFAGAIGGLLREPDRGNRLGRRALDFGRRELDWRWIAMLVEKFYNQTLATRRGRRGRERKILTPRGKA